MRILDSNNNEILDPNEEFGYTQEETILIAHHDAVLPVEEQGHYEVVAIYPNGGRDLAWVVDVEGVEAEEAWDETEDILRWIPYTQEELDAREAARLEEERLEQEAAAALEAEILAKERENAQLRAQVSAMNENLSFLEECLVEMAELIYA